MKDIAIYGAGGFGREIACLIRQINNVEPQWKFIGFFDDGIPKCERNEYGTVLGGINDLNLWKKSISIVMAIGSPLTVKVLADKISNPNVSFPNIIAPTTLFLDRNSVKMGHGNVICNRCTISCNVTIGDFNIFNGYIPVGHDAIIGNYNVFMPSVNVSGGVEIDNCNFFGVQSVVLQYQNVGSNVRIGANSVVMRTAKDGNLYMGNPATKVKL